VEFSGRVLDPEGKPVAGAKLFLAQPTPDGPAPSPRATSGPDGRFRFAVAKAELEKGAAEESPPQMMAVAEGHGCDWVKLGAAEVELTLRLVRDVPIRGRILDADGKPVAGARLSVTGVAAARGDDLGGYIEAARTGSSYEFAKRWTGPLPGRPGVLTTEAHGRFRLDGVGRERVVHLYLEGPAIASTSLEVMTGAAETVAGAAGRLIHGASFDYVAAPSRPVRGVVRDKDTGKPLPGVSVRGWTNPRCQAVTDPEGRYELLGLPKSPNYHLALKPAEGQLYFQRQADVSDTPGLGPLTGDIDLVRGLTARGRVTDKATGRPVAQARVDYQPLYPNPHVNRRLAGMWVPRSEAVTGPDGSYALAVLPGPGVIGVTGPRPDEFGPALVTLQDRKEFFKGTIIDSPHEIVLHVDGGNNRRGALSQDGYHALVLLQPGEKEEELVRDVALEPPHLVKGQVVGPDGRPLTGVTAYGLARVSGKETLSGAEFAVRIHPRASRPLVFHHPDKKLGFLVKELRGDASGPLTVRLQQCGSTSGRVLDQDGQPVAQLRLIVQGTVLHGNGGSQEVTTDPDGRFRAEGLVAGQEYLVSEAGRRFHVFAHVVVEPGKHRDLGDLKAPLDK
jgi:protocatechuate 3,4-dioxygenase beta subunit